MNPHKTTEARRLLYGETHRILVEFLEQENTRSIARGHFMSQTSSSSCQSESPLLPLSAAPGVFSPPEVTSFVDDSPSDNHRPTIGSSSSSQCSNPIDVTKIRRPLPTERESTSDDYLNKRKSSYGTKKSLMKRTKERFKRNLKLPVVGGKHRLLARRFTSDRYSGLNNGAFSQNNVRKRSRNNTMTSSTANLRRAHSDSHATLYSVSMGASSNVAKRKSSGARSRRQSGEVGVFQSLKKKLHNKTKQQMQLDTVFTTPHASSWKRGRNGTIMKVEPPPVPIKLKSVEANACATQERLKPQIVKRPRSLPKPLLDIVQRMSPRSLRNTDKGSMTQQSRLATGLQNLPITPTEDSTIIHRPNIILRQKSDSNNNPYPAPNVTLNSPGIGVENLSLLSPKLPQNDRSSQNSTQEMPTDFAMPMESLATSDVDETLITEEMHETIVVVAKKLAHIGEEYMKKGQPQNAHPVTLSRMHSYEVEMISFVNTKGDQLTERLSGAQNEREFGSAMEFVNVATVNKTDQLALVFMMTAHAARLLGKGTAPVQRLLNHCSLYVVNKFSDWIIEGGGWVTVVEDSSSQSNNELD